MVEFRGISEIINKMDKLADTSDLRQVMGKACAVVERAAKEKAPKDNGELRRSITSEVKEDGQNIIGVVFTPLEYAPYVEFGTGLFAEENGRKDVPWCYQDDEGNWHSTKGQKPQPYLRPALNENREKIKEILGEGIIND